MTREIALHCMKSASELERELCEECPIYGQTGCDHCYEDALQYVIGMLEQEPTDKKITKAELDSIVKALNEGWELRVNEVLGKIRAEILKEHGYSKDYVGTFTYSTIKVATVLRILDKYKDRIGG